MEQNSATSHIHDLPTSVRGFRVSVCVLSAAARWCLGHITALLAFRSDSFWLFLFERGKGAQANAVDN